MRFQAILYKFALVFEFFVKFLNFFLRTHHFQIFPPFSIVVGLLVCQRAAQSDVFCDLEKSGTKWSLFAFFVTFGHWVTTGQGDGISKNGQHQRVCRTRLDYSGWTQLGPTLGWETLPEARWPMLYPLSKIRGFESADEESTACQNACADRDGW